MDTAALRCLREGVEKLGLLLPSGAEAQLQRYFSLLARWNARINLTRIESAEEVVAKHFLDCLAVVPHLGAAQTLVDVGSGAGFPGAVIAIARPDLTVTLVESIAKKGAFLGALRRELGTRWGVEVARFEGLVARSLRFDIAISRATLAPAEWLRRGQELVAPGGAVIAMAGREVEQEIEGEVERVVYALPGAEERRLLIQRLPPLRPVSPP